MKPEAKNEGMNETFNERYINDDQYRLIIIMRNK